MSIFSSFLRSAGPGINAASQLAGGYQNAQVQAALRQQEAARQAKEDQIKELITGATVKHLNAESDALGQPKPAEFEIKEGANGFVRIPKTGGAATVVSDADGNPISGKKTLTPRTFTVNGESMEGFSDPDGNFYDANHNKVSGKITPYAAPQHDSFTFPTGEDDSGKTVILRANTKTGAITPTGQAAKSPVTRVESATNTAAKARLKAAISEMNNAHAGMAEFEKGLSNGTIKIGGASQLLSRTANAFTHDDPLSQTIQATTLTTLNRTNPQLARYVRRALSFAEGESMISQRPSDFRTKMAAFLSAAASGASPEMIADIQSRRNSILNPLNEVNMEGGGKKASSVSSDDADAILAKYGIKK